MNSKYDDAVCSVDLLFFLSKHMQTEERKKKKKDFSRSTTPYCREGVRRQGKKYRDCQNKTRSLMISFNSHTGSHAVDHQY
mgnify:CR=1 FL=1